MLHKKNVYLCGYFLTMIRNFLFHRVNPLRDKLWDPMDVPLFDRCLNYISKNFEVHLIENLIFDDSLKSKKNIATIMFDDGYKDNIEYAADILEKYNIKASFYVVTDSIEHNTLTWTHVLEYLFQNTQQDIIDLNIDIIPEQLRISKLSNYNSRLKYIKILKPYLKTISQKDRSEIINIIISCYNDVELPKLMMNWSDLTELKNAGHYIGSHSVTHGLLGTISNFNELEYEINESATRIQYKLGHRPISISYPVGNYNQKTIETCINSDYKIGLAVKQELYNPLLHNNFEIPRIELYNEPWWKTKLRITHSLEKIKNLIHYR